jgi:hypothetical protein
MPHEPQFIVSERRSTHAPEQRVLGDVHETTHEPVSHTCPDVHITPHAPQCLVSDAVFTQASPHICIGAVHVVTTRQVPLMQLSADAHATPQRPQLRGSVVTSIHAVPHKTVGAMHTAVSGVTRSGTMRSGVTTSIWSATTMSSGRSIEGITSGAVSSGASIDEASSVGRGRNCDGSGSTNNEHPARTVKATRKVNWRMSVLRSFEKLVLKLCLTLLPRSTEAKKLTELCTHLDIVVLLLL